MPEPDETDVDRLLETLRERVEQRRHDGGYPPGLEQDLDNHFAHLAGERPVSASFAMDQLALSLEELRRTAYSRENIITTSRIPGGGFAHRLIAKAVARQIQGVLDQAQQQSQQVARAMTLLGDVTNLLADEYDQRVLQQLDDFRVRLTEQQRELNNMASRVEEVTARIPGVAIDTWYGADAFTAHFRGDEIDMHARYGEIAKQFAGCDPVLDIGFGRGEFLELLRDLGIDAMGIEVEPALVESARAAAACAPTKAVPSSTSALCPTTRSADW